MFFIIAGYRSEPNTVIESLSYVGAFLWLITIKILESRLKLPPSTRALNTLEIIPSSWKCNKIEPFQIYKRISILSFLFSSRQLTIFVKRQLTNCRCCMSYDTHATDWIQFTFIMKESRVVDSYSFWQDEKLLYDVDVNKQLDPRNASI